jgi:3-hydroxyacyl-[acyl-carrier-protein] dehydratase
VIGVAEIKRFIPHRHPILLLDRVLDVEPGRGLTAVKAVTCTEPCFSGDREEYPAALLIESWAQAAVLLFVWERPNPDVSAGMVELAGAINDVRFGRPVLPGDVVEHRVRVVRIIADTAIVAGESVVGASTVLSVGHFVVALRSIDVLRPEPAPYESAPA